MSTKKTPRAEKKFPAFPPVAEKAKRAWPFRWNQVLLVAAAIGVLSFTRLFWANALEIDRAPGFGAAEAGDGNSPASEAAAESSAMEGRPISRAEPGMPMESGSEPPSLVVLVPAVSPEAPPVPERRPEKEGPQWIVPQADPPRPVVGGPTFVDSPVATSGRQGAWQMAVADPPALPADILPSGNQGAANPPAPPARKDPVAAPEMAPQSNTAESVKEPIPGSESEAVKPQPALPGGEAEAPPRNAPGDASEAKPGKALPYPDSGVGQIASMPGNAPEPRVSELTIGIQPKIKGKAPIDVSAETLNRMQTVSYGAVTIRDWTDACYWWDAPALCHQPLYFEEVNLERYGYRCLPVPLVQPFVSGAFFFASIPALPYRMVAEPPCECVYVLGHYRPGSCVPNRVHYPPLDPKAAAAEVGVVGGLILLIP